MASNNPELNTLMVTRRKGGQREGIKKYKLPGVSWGREVQDREQSHLRRQVVIGLTVVITLQGVSVLNRRVMHLKLMYVNYN